MASTFDRSHSTRSRTLRALQIGELHCVVIVACTDLLLDDLAVRLDMCLVLVFLNEESESFVEPWVGSIR